MNKGEAFATPMRKDIPTAARRGMRVMDIFDAFALIMCIIKDQSEQYYN